MEKLPVQNDKPTYKDLEQRVKTLQKESVQYQNELEELKKNDELCRILFENSPSMIYLLDLEGNVIVVNQRSAQQIGLKSDDIRGLNIRQIFPPYIAERHMQAIGRVVRDNKILHSELLETFPTGERWIDARIVPVSDKNDGRIIAVLGISHDITDRKQAERKLRESREKYRALSTIDDLTKLYNSRHFYVRLQNEIERSNRYEQPLTLLMLDLDNFKVFNDEFGHVEGDNVLMKLGQVLKRCLRETDSAYRYGGEEFTVILPMTTSREAVITAERIQAAFRKEIFSPIPGKNVHMTVSIGVAQFRIQEDMKSFVHRADQLMYSVKKNRKDSVCSDLLNQEVFKWQ